jgi:hypothetical protein
VWKSVTVLQIIVVTTCKWLINPIANLNPVFSHCGMSQYKQLTCSSMRLRKHDTGFQENWYKLFLLTGEQQLIHPVGLFPGPEGGEVIWDSEYTSAQFTSNMKGLTGYKECLLHLFLPSLFHTSDRRNLFSSIEDSDKNTYTHTCGPLNLKGHFQSLNSCILCPSPSLKQAVQL